MRKILITGAAGFIGSHLSRKLIEEGYQIAAIKRPESDLRRLVDLSDGIKWYDADISVIQELAPVFQDFRPEIVCHLATNYKVDHKKEDIEELFNTNVRGAVNLLELSRQESVQLFINTSTSFVYGDKENPVTESDPLDPLNLYAVMKLQAEQACSFFSNKYDFTCVSLRLFPPYGPDDHERRLIPHVIKSLINGSDLKLTTGKQLWDFVYVEDIVDAFCKLICKHYLTKGHQVYNIGTGKAVAVSEVVTELKKIINSEIEPQLGAIPHRESEVWHLCADNAKAAKELGWCPETDILGGGLEKTLKWYQHH